MEKCAEMEIKMDKIHIESNSVQETLVIPLWGRKYCTEIYPTIYQDATAEKIMEKLDYDYSALEGKKTAYCSGLDIWKLLSGIPIWEWKWTII